MKVVMLLTMTTIVLLLNACSNLQDSMNTYENEEKVGKADIIQDKRVITDGFLKRRLLFQEIRQSKTNDGFKRIQVFMKNNSVGIKNPNIPYRVLYRFNWYDMDGVLIEEIESTGWQTKLILPGDDVVFTSVAPNKNCHDFKMRIKEAMHQ